MNALTHAQFKASAEAEIAFTVPVEPKGWQRARKNGNRFFKDAETEAFENAVGTFGRQAMGASAPLDGPLSLTVISIMPVPASWSQRKRDAALMGEIRPTGKPDFDNLAKGVSDALNGIIFKDDAQIVDGRSLKFYGARGEVQIAVSRVDYPRKIEASFGGNEARNLAGSSQEGWTGLL